MLEQRSAAICLVKHILNHIHVFYESDPVQKKNYPSTCLHQKAFWHWDALAQFTSKDAFTSNGSDNVVFAIKVNNNILNVKKMCKICM